MTRPVPHIDSSLLGGIQVLGFALCISANSFTVRNPAVLFGGYSTDMEMVLRVISTSAFALAFIVAGLFFLVRKRTIRFDYIIRFAIAALSLGLLFFFVQTSDSDFRLALSVLSLIFFGIYSSLGIVIWSVMIISLDEKRSWKALLFSASFSCIFFFLIIPLLDMVPAIAVFSLMSVCSIAAFVFLHRRNHYEIRAAAPHRDTREVFLKIMKQEGVPVLSLGALGFIFAVSRSLTLSEPIIYANNIEMVTILIAAIILYVLVFVFSVKLDLEKIFICSFPAVAFMLLLLPFSNALIRMLFLALSNTVFSMGIFLLMLVCKDNQEGFSVSGAGLYSVFCGIIYLVLVSGFCLSNIQTGEIYGVSDYVVISLICIYVLSLLVLAGKLPFSNRSRSGQTSLDLVDTACEEIRREYELTEKETEVLRLVAHGRDVPYIANKLYVSKNTVRTHNKHIFRKLAVHSRQECIDLVMKRAE